MRKVVVTVVCIALLIGALALVRFLWFVFGYALPLARVTETTADIRVIETSLTRILADADAEGWDDFFQPEAVRAYLDEQTLRGTVSHFTAARDLYTNVLYDVLLNGRGARGPQTNLVEPVRLQRLMSSYLELETDPWGNQYRIFAGPLPRSGAFESVLHNAILEHGHGAPVNADRLIFVWSFGRNGVDDQGKTVLGGDDINSWDDHRSWESYYHGVNWRYEWERIFGRRAQKGTP
jgi:hypothetical protein